MAGLLKSWHGPAGADSERPLLVLLLPGPLICPSSSGCFCHPVTKSPALTFDPPGMAAGSCSGLLEPVLPCREDGKLSVVQSSSHLGPGTDLALCGSHTSGSALQSTPGFLLFLPSLWSIHHFGLTIPGSVQGQFGAPQDSGRCPCPSQMALDEL